MGFNHTEDLQSPWYPLCYLVIPIVKALYYSTDNMTLLLPLYAKVVDVQLVHVQPVSE